MSFWDYFKFNRTQRSFKQGVRAVNEKRYTDAINLFNEVIARKAYYYVFYLRGVARHFSNQKDAAMEDYNAALTLNENHGPSRNNRGILYLNREDYTRAIEDFSAAIKANQNSFSGRAITYFHMDRVDEAKVDIDEALRRQPGDASVWVTKSFIDRRLGNLNEAFSDLEKAIRFNPNFWSAHNTLAWLLATSEEAEFRDGKRALEHARKAVSFETPPHPACVGTLAAACAEAGQFDEAVHWATSFLENNPPPENVERARHRLELYQQRKPYREPAGIMEAVKDNRSK